MTRTRLTRCGVVLALTLASVGPGTAGTPADNFPEELRKQYPLPGRYEAAARDDPVRVLVIRRYNAIRDIFVLELLRAQIADGTVDPHLSLLPLPRELAELDAELERDPRRLVARLERLLVAAKSTEAYFRERVRTGQDRPQTALRAEAERLAVEVLVLKAKRAPKP